MQHKILQLEIDTTWWMWRGCLQDYYDRYTSPLSCLEAKDSMEREDYKDASAFPIRKPNFDVFGIPQRTRSQRGWYQVQGRHNARPIKHTYNLSAHKPSTYAPAAGEDLPIELVRLVGEMMSKSLEWNNTDDKHTMMACTLVCHYWASQFLPKIFGHVSILSRRRASGLWQLQQSPTCWFHRFVKPQVHVELGSLSELSCIHLLTRYPMSTPLVLRGPLPRGWRTIRSIHQALPRSLPSSFSSGITSLMLFDIHFQRFADLVHLACELPDLNFLWCTTVTWGLFPDTIGTLPQRRQTQKHGTLSVNMGSSLHRRSDTRAQAGVHILTHLLLRKGYPFPPPNIVLALASLVDQMSDTAFIHDSSITAISKVYSGELTSVWDGHRFALELRHMSGFKVFMKATPLPGSDGQVVASAVTQVTIDLSSLYDHQTLSWKSVDWRKLDNQVALLNPTHFVFGFKSRDDMVTFGNEVVDTSMPRALSRGSLRYAVGYLQKWYKAERGSDVLQGPFSCGLYDVYNS